MKLTVAGSGTAIPSGERGSPCFHLEIGKDQLLLDIGSGALHKLSGMGIDIRDVTMVALSHLHPDHTSDLVPFLFALGNPEFSRPGKVTLAGPAGFSEYFSSLVDIYGHWIQPPHVEITCLDLGEETVDFGHWTLGTALTGHTENSLSFRVDEKGKNALVYSGDTPYSDSLVELAKGVELFILECSFPDGHPAEGHLTPSLAAVMAAKSSVSKVLLTHFYPVVEKTDPAAVVREAYDGSVIEARDGMAIEV